MKCDEFQSTWHPTRKDEQDRSTEASSAQKPELSLALC